MDAQKKQSIKEKLETIKCEDETPEVRIRKLKSLINQMNLRLFENPDEKPTILNLQKLGYEAILFVLDSDKKSDEEVRYREKEKTTNLIAILEAEIKG